jgi:Cu/Ag efflux protein CusF
VKAAPLAIALLLPLGAAAQPSVAIVSEPIEATVTVTKVDAKARTVTIRGPAGNLHVLAVPEEAQNLDQVKPGDRFRIAYAEAMAVSVKKGPGKPEGAIEETVSLAPKGAKPGGHKVRTFHVTGVVEAIDYKKRQVALRGPKGSASFPVSPEVKDLESVQVGDRVSIVYSQALALQMEPQPAAQKPAAKKK